MFQRAGGVNIQTQNDDGAAQERFVYFNQRYCVLRRNCQETLCHKASVCGRIIICCKCSWNETGHEHLTASNRLFCCKNIDLQKNRDDNVISEQENSETWSSDDRVGAFFYGLCLDMVRWGQGMSLFKGLNKQNIWYQLITFSWWLKLAPSSCFWPSLGIGSFYIFET